MIDLRLRSMISQQELDQKIGKILTDSDYNLLLTGRSRIRKPDGSLLCVYLPGALDSGLLEQSYATLHSLKTLTSRNRGLASGSQRVHRPNKSDPTAGGRTESLEVSSSLLGAIDPMGPDNYCRLTAWTGRETERFHDLFPLFKTVGDVFAQNVPERYETQMDWIGKTKPDWVIEGTPFTTITVNNTYATGVHTDKGDLDEGFSCLAVLRYGEYSGGRLVFPRYRVAVDLQHGDVILMDAHEWHGNTQLVTQSEDAERISLVAYYRTKIKECGSKTEEELKAEVRKMKKGKLKIG